MSVGDAWSDTTPGSVSKLNKVTVISGTGTYITSLDKDEHSLFRATDTSGGLTVNHLYMVSADGLSLVDVTDVDPHVHSSDSTGGSMFDITNANKDVFDTGAYLITEPRKAKFTELVTSSASIADDIDGTTGELSVKLDTGATNGSVANIKQHGIEWDASKRSWFKSMIRFGTASSLAAKIGVDMENLSSADDDAQKYGIEVCTTTNNNWWVRSATGASRSATDTGTSAMTTSRQSLRLEHYPDLGTPKVDAYIDEGTVFTKTSNIPTTRIGDTAVAAIIRYSFKNNTAASRTLFVYGTRVVYQTVSDWH